MTEKTADIVLALTVALNARSELITRDGMAEIVADVAAFREERFDRAEFDALLDQMNADDEIEISGQGPWILVGRKPRWLAMLRAGWVSDAQLGTVTRVQWGWCVAGEPCAGCGNALCAGGQRS